MQRELTGEGGAASSRRAKGAPAPDSVVAAQRGAHEGAATRLD